MKNFKEIAEKCLKGELSGVFYISDGKSNFTACSKTLTPENNLVYRIITNSGHTLLINSFGYVGMSGLHVVNFIPDMKENDKRTIQISLQQAREWYNSGNDTLRTLALSSFSKKELDPYSRSWEEYCKSHIIGGRWFKSSLSGNIIQVGTDRRESNYPLNMYQDVDTFINKELAEKFIAYMQLMSLRQEWVHIWSQEQGLEKDWEPIWGNRNKDNYCVEYTSVGLEICNYTYKLHSLSFPTMELAQNFLKTFKSLLEQAKGLY